MTVPRTRLSLHTGHMEQNRYIRASTTEVTMSREKASAPAEAVSRRASPSWANPFLSWLSDLGYDPAEVDQDIILRYHSYLLKKHSSSPATVLAKMRQVAAFYAAEDEELHQTLRFSFGLEYDPSAYKQFYSEDELGRLLQAARTSEQRLLLHCGATLGLKASEVLKLTWNLVELDARCLIRSTFTTKSPRRVPFDDDITALFTDQLGNMSASAPDLTRVFTEQQEQKDLLKFLYGLCRQTGVPYRKWEALRNSAGRHWLQETGFSSALHHMGVKDERSVYYLQRSVRHDQGARKDLADATVGGEVGTR